MPAQPTPPRISGYDFIQPLGTGATASVYRYHQRVPSRDVAIKVSSATLDPRAAARFRNEANYMAELSAHPYILSIHDAGVTSTGLGYIVLEYAPGGSYKELIRKRPLTADQMLDLGIKLCSALFTAHCKAREHPHHPAGTAGARRFRHLHERVSGGNPDRFLRAMGRAGSADRTQRRHRSRRHLLLGGDPVRHTDRPFAV